MCAVNGFGRLKGRWRCLLNRLDTDIAVVSKFITACVLLGNICKTRKEPILQRWLEVRRVEEQYPPVQADLINQIYIVEQKLLEIVSVNFSPIPTPDSVNIQFP